MLSFTSVVSILIPILVNDLIYYPIISIGFILKLVVKKYRKKWVAKLYNGIRLLKLQVLDVYNAIFGLLNLQ